MAVNNSNDTSKRASGTAKEEISVVSLYGTPADALKAVHERYNYWTEKLTDSSFQLSLAIIASNWAAFGTVDKILSNNWAKLSLASVLLSLGINLVGTNVIGEQLRNRVLYAEGNTKRWQEEFEAAIGEQSSWPYTDNIDKVAKKLRWGKTWLPLLGGVLFLLALLYQA